MHCLQKLLKFKTPHGIVMLTQEEVDFFKRYELEQQQQQRRQQQQGTRQEQQQQRPQQLQPRTVHVRGAAPPAAAARSYGEPLLQRRRVDDPFIRLRIVAVRSYCGATVMEGRDLGGEGGEWQWAVEVGASNGEP